MPYKKSYYEKLDSSAAELDRERFFGRDVAPRFLTGWSQKSEENLADFFEPESKNDSFKNRQAKNRRAYLKRTGKSETRKYTKTSSHWR